MGTIGFLPCDRVRGPPRRFTGSICRVPERCGALLGNRPRAGDRMRGVFELDKFRLLAPRVFFAACLAVGLRQIKMVCGYAGFSLMAARNSAIAGVV